MTINIITLFPKMIRGFFDESILKQAQAKGLVQIRIINLRDFGVGKHLLVDDRPYGGGAGMLLQAEPLAKALDSCRNLVVDKDFERVILTSARGKKFDQRLAEKWSKLKDLTIIAGHYEGVDQRFIDNRVDEEVSIGDFVMTGGEIATVAIVDAVVRLLPGVLKKEDATREESFMEVNIDELAKLLPRNEIVKKLKTEGAKMVQLLEYPHYTRPENWEGVGVPEILLNGNHAEIRKWRLEKALEVTFGER